MAKKTFLQGLSSEVEHSAAMHTQHGLRLSKVLYEAPTKFSVNSLNDELFHDEQTEYKEQLAKDIQERGILVPLIAKPDGTLLAGHNRLRIAQELKIALVPVQYVEQTLSPSEERKFVINDNLLRRHLSQQQRLELYRKLYPNFDERIAKRTHNRPSQKKVDNVHLPSSNDDNENDFPLTAALIARDTGQKKTAVQKQLQRLQDNIGKESTKTTDSNIRSKKQQAEEKKSVSSTLRTFQKRLQTLQMSVEAADEIERKQMLKELKMFVKSIVP